MEPTWTDGFIKNTIKAFKRYKLKGALIRIKNSIENPTVFFEHLKTLNNKQKVKLVGLKRVEVDSLITIQSINSNKFHDQRVEHAKKMGRLPESSSPIIVVDNIVHDGNHRLDIAKKCGFKEVECLYYESL